MKGTVAVKRGEDRLHGPLARQYRGREQPYGTPEAIVLFGPRRVRRGVGSSIEVRDGSIFIAIKVRLYVRLIHSE